MKIEQGLTLSQFIEFIENKSTSDCEGCLNAIFNYKDFLYRELTKDMFVNEIEKPSEFTGGYNSFCQSDRDKWQEAEKKVIFKGEKIIHGENCIEYNHGNKISVYYYPSHIEDSTVLIYKVGWIDEFKTIGDLFQATNGELELKNIEI